MASSSASRWPGPWLRHRTDFDGRAVLSLDRGLREQLRTEVRAILKERNATAICVTHDQEEALQLADRVAVMNAGRIEQIGHPRKSFTP